MAEMDRARPTVFFMGAGPGAPDLVTLRGLDMLKRADVIVYAGSLVNPKILEYSKQGCETLDSASMTLEEVVSALSSAALAGRTPLRLHSGDPSLYGAIREQIDALASAGIDSEVIPGVSSFSAAAAALGAEYTLPGVSQTLIISRAPGRTPVPDRESLTSLARHRSSLVLFLSSALIDKAASDLISGGYPPDTAAAVVYKASWPDQRIIKGRLSGIADAARRGGVERTALILVGDFLDGHGYERSMLYDPTFSHGYRTAEPGTSQPSDRAPRDENEESPVRGPVAIISLTAAGLRTAMRIKESIGGDVFAPERYASKNGAASFGGSVVDWAAERFHSAGSMIFVSACGVAVRAIAPLLQGKTRDPAVVCLDDEGKNVISLLSGHIGGANGLALRIASITGGNAVVTTATDVRGIESVDGWSVKNDCAVENPAAIKEISSAMLDGRPVGVAITENTDPPPWPVTLWLRPRNLILGIGSKRNVSFESLSSSVSDFLDGAGVSPLSLKAVTSIDLKSAEGAIVEWSKERNLPFMTFGTEELAALEGRFSASERVLRETGVDNVCERSAMLAAERLSPNGGHGVLLRSKTVYDGLTLALARIRTARG
ncbi:MAG: precorrin-4 C(11)-methyltransferase [Synergistaceae bacterium]|jgi:precorrin-4 C11-methyltransferase|nr:precorrin-4 C(11)-methyltransferase [Synergistaceae bacterium]